MGKNLPRKSECARRQHKVLDRRTKSQMHFAAEGIKRAQIASAVGKQRYCVPPNLEEPRLGVVRIGRQDRGAQRPLDAIGGIALPIAPGRVSRTVAARPHSTVPSAIA